MLFSAKICCSEAFENIPFIIKHCVNKPFDTEYNNQVFGRSSEHLNLREMSDKSNYSLIFTFDARKDKTGNQTAFLLSPCCFVDYLMNDAEGNTVYKAYCSHAHQTQ